MRTALKFSIAALAVAVGITACGDAKATEASQEDLKRDLELASSTTMNLATPKVDPSLLTLETKPQGAPETAKVVKKGAGPRAVRSQAPTVLATPEMDVAAVDESEDVTESESIAPVPESTEPVAVAPRPQPVIIQTAGGGDYGTSGNGGGVFGGGSGSGGRGAIIRGGGVDGDNCDLHRGGRGTRGPIYIPTTNAPRTGGVIVNRPVGSGIGIGSRSIPGIGSVARSTPSRSSSPSSSRGVSSPRGVFSPRGR